MSVIYHLCIMIFTVLQKSYALSRGWCLPFSEFDQHHSVCLCFCVI